MGAVREPKVTFGLGSFPECSLKCRRSYFPIAFRLTAPRVGRNSLPDSNLADRCAEAGVPGGGWVLVSDFRISEKVDEKVQKK